MPPEMSNDEAVQIMIRCKEEILGLLAIIARLEPKADAYDTLTFDANAWRTMESAPRDGTIFNAWLGDAPDDDIEFYCIPRTRLAPGWQWRDGRFRPVGGLVGSIFVQPTHWMPLPTPPTIRKAK